MPGIVKTVQDKGEKLALTWTIAIQHISERGVSAIVSDKNSHATTPVALLPNGGSHWYECARCPCSRTQADGFPCPHLAFLFRKGAEAVDHFYNNHKVPASARINCAPVLNLNLPHWYHPSLRLVNLAALYSIPCGLVAPLDCSGLPPYQVAPWNNDTKNSSSRRLKRFTHKTEGRRHKRRAFRIQGTSKEQRTELDLAELAAEARGPLVPLGPAAFLSDTAADEGDLFDYDDDDNEGDFDDGGIAADLAALGDGLAGAWCQACCARRRSRRAWCQACCARRWTRRACCRACCAWRWIRRRRGQTRPYLQVRLSFSLFSGLLSPSPPLTTIFHL